jgi:C-terminal processing protease CtpA/Prc
MKEVEKSYVVPVKPDELTTGALKGMLTRLDPHSDYMDESEFRDLMATTSGQFGGVGIEISVDDGVPQVISAIEGTPAAAAGISTRATASSRPMVSRSSAWISRRSCASCAARPAPR